MIKVQCECKLYVFSFLKNKILNFRRIENYYWNIFPTEFPVGTNPILTTDKSVVNVPISDGLIRRKKPCVCRFIFRRKRISDGKSVVNVPLSDGMFSDATLTTEILFPTDLVLFTTDFGRRK